MDFSLRADFFSDISDEDDEFLLKASQKAEEEIVVNNYLNDGCDEDIILATQQVEGSLVTQQVETSLAIQQIESGFGTKILGRFATPVDRSALDQIVVQSVPESTRPKSKWDVNAFENLRKSRNAIVTEQIDQDLLQLPNEKLNLALSFFVVEVRNQSGGDYCPKTLYEMLISIQHHLRSNGRPVTFLDGQEFSGLRSVLDARMKAFSKTGLGLKSKQAGVILANQEDTLWEKGLLGTDSPQTLLNTLLFLIGLNFALRAGQEYRHLRTGSLSQIKICVSPAGRRYLDYVEDVSKSNNGGLRNRNVAPKVENVDKPERCVVRIYEKYMSKRPTNGKSTAFYLRPKRRYNEDTWFDDAPVGIHTLQNTVGRICKGAGLDGFYTNHSLRATAATRLFEEGVDEQLISEKTGHRSTAVRSYMRTSNQQQEHISDLVQSVKRPKCEPSSTSGSTSGREISFEGHGISFNVKF